jgi:hypothetical protein
MSFDAPEPPGPSAEELAAAERARRERIESTQENVQDQSDRFFRLYTARSMFGLR